MAHHFRKPERRQAFLLSADMMDWLPEGDIVHLIVDAVALDGTKVGANAALDANRTASRIDEQVTRMLAEAEAASCQQEKIDARAAAEQASGKRKRGRKSKPAEAAVDPGTMANVSDPEGGIMKALHGWLQGDNA